MSLNQNAILVAESLLAKAEEYRVSGLRSTAVACLSIAASNQEVGCSRGSSWAVSAWEGWGRSRSCPASWGSRPFAGSGCDRPPGSRMPGQSVCGLGTQGGKVLRDGLGPDAGGGRERGDFRRDRLSRNVRGGRRRARTRKPPPPAIVAKIAQTCRVEAAAVTLLAAPTASLAGGLQIVARSVETALHKLAELKFDLSRIVSAVGTAPLPPVAANDLAAIGRTNDAILYGAGSSWLSPGTIRASNRSARRCRRRPHATTASRLRRSSRGTTTISMRSILTSSARPRSASRTSKRARLIPSGK